MTSPFDEEIVTAKIAEISAIADYYPGVVVVLNDQANQVEYMSARGLHQLGTTVAALSAMGMDYYDRYFNPEEAHEYVPKIVDLLERNDLQYSVSFFQQVRTGPKQEFKWHLSTARVLAQGQAGQPLLIVCFSCPIDPESHVTAKVQRLLDENNFLRRNTATFALLTTREREVLRYLALGSSSADIAVRLHLSVQTAETHRRNIRQKLNATSAFDLGQYARAFNLI
jgi:DNA-binding CsgD family transcriptional regulator